VVNVEGDSSCFYHAISRALTGHNGYHASLRYLLAKFVSKNAGTDNEFSGLCHDERLVSEIAGREHAGELEFQWMAAMLRLQIYVFYAVAAPGATYRWHEFKPIHYIASNEHHAGIHLFFCGSDLLQYQRPNHFALVIEV
jgi:hypothetical protein